MINTNKKIQYLLYHYTPAILLFVSILSEIDFNNSEFKYFSFNFAYILIFHYSLKREGSIGYIIIFIAGLFNDVVHGIPMGISSLCYLLLCAAAAYLRNITLRPNIIKDWFFFLITVMILNLITFVFLILFFDYKINYFDQMINTIFTFLLYVFFSYLFRAYDNIILGKYN
ncbi:rod shape-determining protein MreD [Candidatus Pelagibacter sp.]|nr:rod shape-determining protein MreD [Candidatus Pelagibacter sp.]|tara:strand:- start:1163 stop:1675 length:513 start_codon:yes stop_codon:yes gene_type:complete